MITKILCIKLNYTIDREMRQYGKYVLKIVGTMKRSYITRKIMKNKKVKCDIYTRVSTTMQVDGYSLDAQKEKLKRYAEFQNMEIVNEYSDNGGT